MCTKCLLKCQVVTALLCYHSETASVLSCITLKVKSCLSCRPSNTLFSLLPWNKVQHEEVFNLVLLALKESICMTSTCLTNKSMLLIGDRLCPDTRLKLCSILYFLCIPHLLNKSRATSQFVRVQLYSFGTGTLVSLSYTILHCHLGILSVHKSRVTPAYYTLKKKS